MSHPADKKNSNQSNCGFRGRCWTTEATGLGAGEARALDSAEGPLEVLCGLDVLAKGTSSSGSIGGGDREAGADLAFSFCRRSFLMYAMSSGDIFSTGTSMMTPLILCSLILPFPRPRNSASTLNWPVLSCQTLVRAGLGPEIACQPCRCAEIQGVTYGFGMFPWVDQADSDLWDSAGLWPRQHRFPMDAVATSGAQAVHLIDRLRACND
jgi:hypothetical protein